MQPSKAWIINDTIEKNKRVFKIPVYQRNYDWNNVQCEKLYSDIIEAYNTQKKHFTGTIVYITGDHNSSSLSEDLIIDGQQRVTTLMILLKAMLDIATDTDDSLKSELSDLLFNRHCEEDYKLKLKPVKADNKQFQALMQNNEELYDKNSNIIRNYNLFKKLIYNSLQNGLLLSDILEGTKKLEIVEIVLDKSQGDDPQVIFESINSTGLELSLADKIRNFVLMDDVNQDELFNRYWLPLEEKIGNKSLADYFTTYLDFKLTEKVSKDNAYDKFTKHFKNNSISHEEILIELNKYAKYYAAFIRKSDYYSIKVNKYLSDFRAIDQSTLYPFLFCVFDDYENNVITEETLLKVLSFFRSYSVRRIVCERSSNSLRGLYKTLYSRLFKDKVSNDNYYATIYSFFVTTNTKDKIVDDSEFLDSLVHKKLYTKKKMCKFLLSSIENENSHETINVDNMSIEHILPQKENALVWKTALGEKYYDIYTTYLHTLGNLTITGYNSELGTKSFSEKKKMISDLSKARVLNELILSAEKWDEESILKRAKKLSSLALQIFNIEQVELVQSRAILDDEQSYSLDDYNDISGTTPISYSFYGENVTVNTYSNMLSSIIETLYDLDSSIFENLAKEKFKATTSERIYISMDETDLRRKKEIGNSGIFYENNLSAGSILQFIKVLIEKHNLDPDEFDFICKQ